MFFEESVWSYLGLEIFGTASERIVGLYVTGFFSLLRAHTTVTTTYINLTRSVKRNEDVGGSGRDDPGES